MFETVRCTIEKYNMLSENDRVVVAVSGGPDSMALLHFLYSIKERYSLYIHVAHLNHMLRGEESEGDTSYVEEFCKKMYIPFTVQYVNIDDMARMEGISLEEAGRIARYTLFDDVAEKISGNKIALAHNMNDQAETVLMRIIRGTGLEGLTGIKPVRDGRYIRPLINTPRWEIEEYCSINKLEPRIDSTNLEPIATRNKIRLQLIPFLKENYSKNIEPSLSSMAELLRDDNDFISGLVDEKYRASAVTDRGNVYFNIENIKGEHISIRKRLIRKAINAVKGNLNEIENRHIELILSIVDSGRTGEAVELPGGLRCETSYGRVYIKVPSSDKARMGFCYAVSIPGVTHISEIQGLLRTEVMDVNLFSPDDNNEFVKYFDYDKIRDIIAVRPRKQGDFIVPIGMKGRQKIKDLFINCKIHRDKRDLIPLIVSKGEVIWVVGLKISDNYKITKDTKKVLKIEFIKQGEYRC